MDKDRRDTLWELVFVTFYDSFFEELVAEVLIKRWQLLDTITKVLIALTASTSAVTGWAFWNQEPFRNVWMFISGVTAILAILHSVLIVPTRLKDWTDTKSFFSGLRIEIDTLRGQMEIDPEFSIHDVNIKFLEFRKQYKEGIQQIKNDILRTKKLEVKIQDQLNQRIEDQIIT